MLLSITYQPADWVVSNGPTKVTSSTPHWHILYPSYLKSNLWAEVSEFYIRVFICMLSSADLSAY
jgi:hypothetical protein